DPSAFHATRKKFIVIARLTPGLRCWTLRLGGGKSGPDHRDSVSGDEGFPAPASHLVERPDAQHPGLDLALWRACRHRRIRQPLLPDQGRQDRSGAWLRAALGDL